MPQAPILACPTPSLTTNPASMLGVRTIKIPYYHILTFSLSLSHNMPFTILQHKVKDILVVLDARVQLSFSERLVGSNPRRYYDSDDDDGDYLRTSLL